MKTSVNILIAHRSPLYRRGLELALRDTSVACEIETTDHFHDLSRSWLPATGFSLLILDDGLPGLSCFCKLQDLVERHRAPILLCSANQDPAFARKLKRCGVRGVLPATMNASELSHALVQLSAGADWIEPRRQTASGSCTAEAMQHLTATELRVLLSLGEGLANKQIAHTLNLSVHTVKTHMSNIFRKLDVSNRTKLAMSVQQLRLSV